MHMITRGKGRPSVQTHDLIVQVNTKVQENQLYTISVIGILAYFRVQRTVYRFLTVKLGWHKLCAMWMPKKTNWHEEKPEVGICTCTFGPLWKRETDFSPYHYCWWDADFIQQWWVKTTIHAVALFTFIKQTQSVWWIMTTVYVRYIGCPTGGFCGARSTITADVYYENFQNWGVQFRTSGIGYCHQKLYLSLIHI